MVKVEWFTTLDGVERDAAGALDRERQPILFDRLSWYRLLQQHCPPPGKLLVARADAYGQRSWLFLTVQNGRASAYANWYTFRFGLVPEGSADRVRTESAIADALRGFGISGLDLHPLHDASAMRDGFLHAGWSASVRPAAASWIADVAGSSFADYWSSRPARLRNTGERKARSSEPDCRIFSSFDAAAWAAYEEVYATSWKPDEGSAAFLCALAQQEGAAGTLRLGIALLGGEPVAAQFWLVENGRATIHKLAHREDAKQHSPGTLLSMAMFRHAIDVDHVALIDFGLGDEAFKADWMNRREEMERLTAFDLHTLAGLAGAGRAAAAKLVRSARSH